jgi:hypothetical protein
VKVLLAAFVVLALAGCTSDPNNDKEGAMATNETGATLWDFRTPVTTTDLGSSLDDLVELDGPVDLEVIFPSGRRLAGNWARGALGFTEGGANLGDEPAEPISQIDLREDEADSVEAVRASAERFMTEFGPSVRGSDLDSITEYLDEFEAIVDAAGGTISPAGHGDGPDGLGSTVRAFWAEEQDGITPAWLIRVVDGGVTLRTSISFEPAPDE